MKVELSNISKKFLKNCDKEDVVRIIRQIDELALHPFNQNSIKLGGGEDLYRLRVGKYRIIYKIISNIILVTEIGKRQNVYK